MKMMKMIEPAENLKVSVQIWQLFISQVLFINLFLYLVFKFNEKIFTFIRKILKSLFKFKSNFVEKFYFYFTTLFFTKHERIFIKHSV